MIEDAIPQERQPKPIMVHVGRERVHFQFYRYGSGGRIKEGFCGRIPRAQFAELLELLRQVPEGKSQTFFSGFDERQIEFVKPQNEELVQL